MLEEKYNTSVCTRLPFTESNLKWLLSKKPELGNMTPKGSGRYYIATKDVTKVVTTCRAYFVEELMFVTDDHGVIITK